MSSNEIVAVLRQALEALEYPLNTRYEVFDVDMAELLAHRAITSLRQAIATAVAEPHKESSNAAKAAATKEPVALMHTEPKYVRIIDGLPCLTLAEHQHIVRTLAHPQPKADA